MEDTKFCDYCHEPLNGQKPFIPVNSNVRYHWKCYIKKVRTEEVAILSMDENIIVVDDDRNLLESVRRALVTAGFQKVKIESKSEISIQAIERKQDGSFVVRVEVPKHTNKAAIEKSFQAHQEDGLVVLAINVQETRSKAANFGNNLGVGFNLLMDGEGAVTREYRVFSMPTSYFVDRFGVIQAIAIGGMDRETIEDYLTTILY